MIAEFLTGISYVNIYHLLVVIPLVTLNESLGTITLEVNALPVHFSMVVSVFVAFHRGIWSQRPNHTF
jgi:hypothetical protein